MVMLAILQQVGGLTLSMGKIPTAIRLEWKTLSNQVSVAVQLSKSPWKPERSEDEIAFP